MKLKTRAQETGYSLFMNYTRNIVVDVVIMRFCSRRERTADGDIRAKATSFPRDCRTMRSRSPKTPMSVRICECVRSSSGRACVYVRACVRACVSSS